jgi:hypothetical protein
MGGGGKQLLSFAACEADIVGIGPQAKAGGGLHHEQETEECLADKIAWVREAAGARFAELELAMLVWAVAITDDRRGAAERIAQQRSRPVDEILGSPFYLIGTVDSIVDILVERRARNGISYISVFPSHTQSFGPVVSRLAGH